MFRLAVTSLVVLLTASTHASSISEIAEEAGITKHSVQLAFTFGERYGIHGQTLVSLWLKETNCGRYMGRNKPAETMTAADYSAFVKICQRVGRDPKQEVCSPAGAIGLTQFMPKMWLHYGVDADNDGVANPWSVADALASSANFLQDHKYDQAPWSAVCNYNGGPKCRIWSVQHYTNVILKRAKRWGAPLDL